MALGERSSVRLRRVVAADLASEGVERALRIGVL
jgi:hypothetical protein